MDKEDCCHKIAEKQTPLSYRKILLAVISGVLLTASFPPVNLSFLSWLALVPILKSLENEPPSRAFKLGFIAGAVHYLTLIYWIIVVLGRYGNLNFFFSSIPYLLLCFYLALYPALFSLMITFLWKSRFALILMGSFWVGLEYVRASFLTGFPWCLLGYTQYKQLHLIQIADLFGVYGLSFLIVLVNGLLYFLFFSTQRKNNTQTGRGFLKCEILITGLIAVATLVYGQYRLSEKQMEKASRPYIRAVVIQGNIDQSLKWDPTYQAATIATYQRLTRETFDFKPELIVWPETSAPFFFQDNAELSPKVVSIAKESGAALVFGSPAYKQVSGMIKHYNRAYLISPYDRRLQYYDKMHLVPFGEYVPLKKFLYFINRLVPAAGDFAQGTETVSLDHDNLSIGILICFEAIFPELARDHAMKGANILVNITNDAWFGKTSAPYQHLAMAVFRAVENRRPMIRAANTGFSAFIEPQGKIIARSGLFTEETLKISLDISKHPLTFYTRFGDLFALLLLGISLIKTFSLIKRLRNLRYLF